jgi:chromosomal replication initiation ATPase DnaA
MLEKQLLLPLFFKPVYTEKDFVVSSCNVDAYETIRHWPVWPANTLLLYGPSGCGKTHLVHIWQHLSQAYDITSDGSLFLPEHHCLFMENIEQLKDESILFHRYNMIAETKGFLLLTSKVHPKDLPFTLPDLRSRLLAIPSIGLGMPDEALLKDVCMKLINDRQLNIKHEVIDYIVARMERSFATLHRIIDKLDKEALAQKHKITIPFVRQVLTGIID